MHTYVKLAQVTLSIILGVLFTGCVTGRRIVTLETPDIPAISSNGTTFRIVSVVDDRVFRNNPSDPSIPSIDGDVKMLGPEEKSSMIGRQRNGYGKALGDIALPDGESIINEVELLLKEGLDSIGYDAVDLPSEDLSVNVSVNEFWAWFGPGVFSLEFHARLKCTINFKGRDIEEEFVVGGEGVNVGQVASNENWKLAYTRAYEDFLKHFTLKVSQTLLHDAK